MIPIILHPEAEGEFEVAADYYDAQRTGYGEVFRAAVAGGLSQIASTPTVFSPYKGGPTRRLIIKRFGYAIYFVERDEAVHVVAIVNQRRKPDYWEDRIDDI